MKIIKVSLYLRSSFGFKICPFSHLIHQYYQSYFGAIRGQCRWRHPKPVSLALRSLRLAATLAEARYERQ